MSLRSVDAIAGAAGPNHGRPAPVALDKRALRRLLAPGAYLSPINAATFTVYSPRNKFAAGLAEIQTGAVERMRAEGLLGPSTGAPGRLRLTRRGVAAVRADMSTPVGCTSPMPLSKTPTPRAEAASRAPPERAHHDPDRDVTSPLAWLRRRKDRDGRPMISGAQFDAGERLSADFQRGHMMPRTTLNWNAIAHGTGRVSQGGGGIGVEISDGTMAAQTRVRKALDGVGPELAGILIDVCCFEKGIEAAEQQQGLPQRSGKVVLQLALTRLARHYGLIAAEPVSSSYLRHWAAGDYRPILGAVLENDVPLAARPDQA